MSESINDFHGIDLKNIAEDNGGSMRRSDVPDLVHRLVENGDLVFVAEAEDGSEVRGFDLVDGYAFLKFSSSSGPENYYVYSNPEEKIQEGIDEHEADAGVEYEVVQNDSNYSIGK